jgi:predicted RNA-binding Zn ribbon-like protein
MRLDGGHPALDLVNTIYASAALEPIDYDVLVTPTDLSVFAARVGLAPAGTPSSARALRAARALRSALDPIFRAIAVGSDPPHGSLTELEGFARRALIPATLARTRASDVLVRWTWPADDPATPVHRLALSAVDLLGDAGELARLHRCHGCCWLFLDHSRGRGRRWCSMADCGGEAKKRRYIEKRRADKSV